MSVINTNTLSLVTQNNLTKSQGALNSAIERLSSGMRINSAKDDSAGQAIANRFTASIKGLTQASRNANDGISIAQTTEGALNEVNTNLQRIRELTVQSANGSNSAADKVSMQTEIGQRLGEINRLSAQTDFNGIKVLRADVSPMNIQVGAHDGQGISIGLTGIDTTSLGLTSFSVAGVTPAVPGFDVAGVSGAKTKLDDTTAQVAIDLSTALKPTSDTGPTAEPGATGSYSSFIKDALGNIFAEYTGGTVSAGTADATGNGFYAVTIDSTNGSATVSATKEVASPTGTAITETDVVTTGASYGGADAGAVFTYSGTEDGAPTAVIKDTSGATDAYYAAVIDGNGVVTRGALQVDGVPATGTAATANPLKSLDDALAIVDGLRGNLGAVQNRFDSVIANLGSTIVNLSASRSRIEDADYATEVSNMTRAQILQQAGTSVLAKANSSTEGVMSLLR